LSPSRSSAGLVLPGEAPLGTAARPCAPLEQDDLGLDGGIAPAVEDLARVDFDDGGHGRNPTPAVRTPSTLPRRAPIAAAERATSASRSS
jgi:hypothetical protein